MEELISELGYLALSIGTFFEGETAILIASSIARSGATNIFAVIFFGFLGSFVSDWLYFLIGRLNGKYFIDKRPTLKNKLAPIQLFFEKNRVQLLVSYRFLYGFRVVIPLMLGMSDIKPLQFLVYSVSSGLLWASLISLLGYFVGSYLELNPLFIKENIFFLIVGFASVGVVIGFSLNKFVKSRLEIEK